ncbi:hypothetical protein JK361_06410 [Streptomyces sp. 5-8]|uniref:PknH-like extracellular domain-containing protein n=1 Tax=Streptomyces musisoli TaxID=2802280 RepID=A0ABS1NVV2_9ACTN|nr:MULTISPECIES: hypothetical protein [Streptomyces]MBL1104240.1 hypothetical protein [Streptomyces musisoli]MBY8844399.1 hypothetical protein [Streptomyces sp. SP2-10]
MPKRTRAGTLLAVAVTGLTVALAAPATAAPKAPGFLAAADLPPHPTSSWTAGKVTAGVPEETDWDTCLRALPGHGSAWHRDFRTDLDTNARQITVVLPDAQSAKQLTSRLNKDIKSCAARIERQDPDTEATGKDYGNLSVEEGAHVYGVHTETSWGASDVRLLSVGRDGRTVTVVHWAQLGGFEGAPVKAFKTTTTKAVNKLH